MNPNSETSNVFIIIKNVTPKSLLTGNMDEMERVRVILRTLKTNPKLHNVSDDTLIKEIVFLIMRNKNLNKPNVDIHMLYPMLLVGLNDANSSDLDLSQDELIDKILVQNNEVDVNNKMNVALSNVISNLPSDLESQVPPEIKSTLMEQFANSIPSYNNIRNAMNKQSKKYWASINSDSYNSSSSDTNSSNNNDNSNNNDYLTMNIGNRYNVLSNDYDKKHRKFAEDDELLASYVDTEPEIHVDRDDNLYIHDTYSKTLHNIPDDLKNVSLEQVEEILTKHEVDAKEVDNILDKLRKKDVDSEELEKVIEEEEEETLLDIIRNYQKEYTVINYIVSVILIALLLSLIVYIVMKIRKN